VSIRDAFRSIDAVKDSPIIDEIVREASGNVNENYVTAALYRNLQHTEIHGKFTLQILVWTNVRKIIGRDYKHFNDEGEADYRFNVLVREYHLVAPQMEEAEAKI